MTDVLEQEAPAQITEAEAVVAEAITPEQAYVALVNGVGLTKLPDDLYIPPDALEVFLDAFAGPLDLLLYLIRKQNFDILNIPIAAITHQYMEYVDLMKDLKLELAAEYLVMAAMLAEIKSRMLLPRSENAPEEEDPRAELVRRLQEYERFKIVAEQIDALPRLGRDTFCGSADVPKVVFTAPKPEIDLSELLGAFMDILKRSELLATHKVEKEALSVRERMSSLLELVNKNRFISFYDCFTISEGRLGVVVSFLAMLELLRLGAIDIVQSEPFGPIHVKVVDHEEPFEALEKTGEETGEDLYAGGTRDGAYGNIPRRTSRARDRADIREEIAEEAYETGISGERGATGINVESSGRASPESERETSLQVDERTDPDC